MNSKIFGILVVLALISFVPIVNAQISIGEKASQKSVEVIINSADDVNVKHIVNPSKIPISVSLIDNSISELIVVDENGEEKEFGIIGDNQEIMIFPTTTNSIIKYNLENVFEKKDGLNSIKIKYDQTVSIITPKDVNLIFVNDTAILLNDKKGLSCHGCDISLDYFENDEMILQEVNWEEEKFIIEMHTNSEIKNFEFNQQEKNISFDIKSKNKFIVILMPLELLWEPYNVFLDDEKIKVQKISISDTHVLLNIKPQSNGTISIIGTTVIPEFPIVAPLAIGFLIILVIPFMKKINLH